jgi:beta-mannosidase
VVNGRPVFLQGVNFAPIRANYADLTREDYETRLKVYRDLGCNIFRINACGFLEKECFYELCDELGLMVWQEFPLTSSGIENWPPEDETSIAEMELIARSFIERRRYHASLIIWCGGNKLQGNLEGNKTGVGRPCPTDHPMLKRLGGLVRQLDGGRRYIHTSPSGPRACAAAGDFGKGLHWDVHGPYSVFGSPQEEKQYWSADDALFRSELCCQGASPVEQIEKHAGGLPVFPATADSPFWSHPTRWWIDWPRLVAAHGREPRDLAEYVAWSQASQAEALCAGMKACKARFPRCGGVLLWTGHDTSPIPINTSILDYEGRPKPAALALAEVWRSPAPRTAGGGQTCDS